MTATGAGEHSGCHALASQLPQFTFRIAEGVVDAMSKLRESSSQAVVADCPLGDWSAEELIEEIQRIDGFVPVIVRAAQASLEDAVRVMKLGAYYFLQRDEEFDAGQLARLIANAVDYYRERVGAWKDHSLAREPWRKVLVGESKAMEDVVRMIRLVGPRRSTVLISGETGTGKELVARAVHLASGRAHLPMVAVNCTALPENLLEAELFGHVKGAFTGAIQSRIGRFEQANRSTLFLDEIGDLPLEVQAKLLRVLQEKEFQRLGSSETVRVDARVISATNVDILEHVRDGRFREDLYYRLNVIPITIPPLRDRRGDIPALVHHFSEKICRQEEIPHKKVTRETTDRLMHYSWPGNIRQLENAVERAVTLSGDRECLHAGDFSLPAPSHWKTAISTVPEIQVPAEGLDFESTVGRVERTLIEQALRLTKGNKKQAADMLRLKRTTLTAKLKSLEAIAVNA